MHKKGQALTEYLILLIIIAVASISLTQSIGKHLRGKLKLARDHIDKDITLNDDG